MVYYATDVTEKIYLYHEHNPSDAHYITLTKSGDFPSFYVQCCCNKKWFWEFKMDNISNYEMIKHVVMDTIMESANMRELLEKLDEQFEEIFDDIVDWDTEWDDSEECCCENCNHRDCLN